MILPSVATRRLTTRALGVLRHLGQQTIQTLMRIVGGRFGINSALLVNRTLGLRNIEQMEPREADADPRPWVGERYADPQGNVWKRLNLRNLLGQPDFLEIGLA